MASESEAQLEKEYSPSMWTKRFKDRDQVIQHHIQHIEKASQEAVANVKNELDIPYGDSRRQKLDIFGTDLPDDAPILVFIHGGYWQELSREQSRYPAGPLHRAGYRTIIVGYELCPRVTVSQIVQQIQKAARFVFEYAGKKQSKGIYFAGHSAGAHLIAKMLSSAFLKSLPNPELLRAAILIAGVYDLTHLVRTTNNEALHLTATEAKEMSPHFDSYYHLRDYDLRLYILAAEHDSYTFRRQSQDFYDMLQECCRVENIDFKIRDGLDHFDIVELTTDEDNHLVKLLNNDFCKYT